MPPIYLEAGQSTIGTAGLEEEMDYQIARLSKSAKTPPKLRETLTSIFSHKKDVA